MTIIQNKEDWIKFYAYDKKYLKKYPKHYPCIAKKEREERGIMGDACIIM